MRTFIENLGRKIGDTAETMANKAGDAVEIQRLRSQIKSLEYSSEKDYVELGKMTYDKFKAEELLAEQASAICEAICSREKRISKYEEQICKIKGSVKCGGCDKAVEKEMTYCPHCGIKVPEPQTSEMTDYTDYTDDAQDVEEKVMDMADEVKQKADSAADAMGEKAEETAETMGEKAEESAETIGEKVDQAADAIKDKSQDVAEAIREKAANTAEIVKEKVKEMEEKIKSMTEK